jgi:hypothetical protein
MFIDKVRLSKNSFKNHESNFWNCSDHLLRLSFSELFLKYRLLPDSVE